MDQKRRPGRPRTKPAEQRRDDLLNAAQRLFLDQGFAATSVDKITAAAGVAKGTFYLYFTTKEDVRAALAERVARRHLEAIERAVAAAPERPIEAWAEACMAFQSEELASAPIIDHLTGLLTPIAEEPRPLAVFLFSGIRAVVDEAAATGKPVDRARLTEWVKALCGKPRAIPAPAKPKPPEQRQGSLF